ncbi:MAG: choice-of-anchor A family protein [Verrucomicrobia bacterium]|nr:choice-of-anchor A family protein [Verrucomicrobiota bacterium]
MRYQFLVSLLSLSAAVLPVGTAYANSASALQDFTVQMGSRNVITSGAFTTDSHVHGTVAVGGTAMLKGNAEINSHGNGSAEALRVYGDLKLVGETKVLSGGATVVKNSKTNSKLTLNPGKPNPNQATIVNGGTLMFNGNGGTPALSSLASADDFFTSRDSAMQAANTELLNSGTYAPTKIDSDTIYFNALTSGVSVFNWNINQLTSIAEVGFNFSADSFIVVNIIGNTPNSTWNASFNTLGGSDYLAQHLLWNIGVATVNFTGSEILGSILAPDSKINSHKQLNGAIYAESLNQHGQEIHYTHPNTPPVKDVPEEPSLLVLALACMAMGAAVWVKRFVG